MNFIKKNLIGILVCFFIAIPSWLIGKIFPVIGGPVIAILAGMVITCFWTNKKKCRIRNQMDFQNHFADRCRPPWFWYEPRSYFADRTSIPSDYHQHN